MEVKSVTDCLNIINFAKVEDIVASSHLEDIHKYFLEKEESEFIEDRVALSKVLSQINSMIENYYQFPEKDIPVDQFCFFKLQDMDSSSI